MINGKARDLLADFSPISLEEMDGVKLMDRTDTKFAFEHSALPEFLALLKPHYRVLEVAGNRVSRYETLYYDSVGYGLYSRHHSGKANRFKVRARRYVESDTCFFEIKHKTNKGRTIKRRVKTDGISVAVPAQGVELLAELTGLAPDEVKGCIWVDYGRITLVGKTIPERLTIDVDLAYRIGEEKVDVSHIVIAEVKRDRSAGSPAIDALRQLRIKQQSLSKYCVGVALLSETVKVNNFKEKLRYIQKLSHAV